MNKPVLYIESNTLCHYGIKGQQWGRRLYQNKDGSLTAAGKIRYGDKNYRTRVIDLAYMEAKNISGKSRRQKDYDSYSDYVKSIKPKDLITTWSRNSSHPSQQYTMEGTYNDLNGWRTTLKPAKLVYHVPEKKEYYEETGNLGVNVSSDTAKRLFNSNYDDLSDDDLDTLYQLSGDKDVLKYRMQRTAKVVAAGKKYSESSMVSKLLQTAVAKIPDMPKIIEKGAKAVAKMVTNGLDTLKNNVTKAKEEREAKKAAEEAKKERALNRAVANRAR